MRAAALALLLLPLLPAAPALGQEGAEPTIDVAIDPREATVGQAIAMTVTVTLPDGVQLEPVAVGPDLGPFAVVEGNWIEAQGRDAGRLWTWRGRISAFRTGEHVIPPIEVQVRDAEGLRTLAADVGTVTVVSVLEGEDLELAELKPPASVPADWGALRGALAVIALLTAAALVAYWLHRRYAARLARVDVASDPFLRTPPHVWVYAELQKLLEQRLAEEGRIERFHVELSRILKRYLSGRYRVELIERTSEEVPGLLTLAGAPAEAIDEAAQVLSRCDRVKFAGALPAAAEWKAAVEEVYRIVDRTRPAEEPREAGAA